MSTVPHSTAREARLRAEGQRRVGVWLDAEAQRALVLVCAQFKITANEALRVAVCDWAAELEDDKR